MALYIDADNISYNYISDIINHIKSSKQKLYIKKIYCDWSKTESKNCAKIISDYGLEPIQCFRLGKKQSTDIKLITDVITDMNYNNNNISKGANNYIENVYLATSDVDFTFLCQELKKMGKHITLFCLQNSLLSNYVDEVINLKKPDICDIIRTEITELISVRKLKQKIYKKYNTEIDEDNIIKSINSNFYIITKNNDIKYIINIDKASKIKNIKNSEFYDRLRKLVSKSEVNEILDLFNL